MTKDLVNARGWFWWADETIPEGHFAPANPVPGALTIGPDGETSLRLDGVLPRTNTDVSNQNEMRQCGPICGVLDDRTQHVLLVDPIRDGSMTWAHGPCTEEFKSLISMVKDGLFPKNIDTFSVQDIIFPLDGYESWLGFSPFTVSRNKKSGRASAVYAKPKKRSWRQDIGKISIETHLTYSIPGKHEKITLESRNSLKINFINPLTLLRTKALSESIESFLITITSPKNIVRYPKINLSKKNITLSATMYYARNSGNYYDLRWHECLTRFSYIENDFGSILSKWLHHYENSGPGFYLYVSAFRYKNLYPEHRFANLIWGLESLHRYLYDEYHKKPEVQEKIERIIDQITLSKDKKYARRSLSYNLKKTLSERLEEMFTTINIGLNELSLKGFSKMCANLRNDISHHGAGTEYKNTLDYLNHLIDLSRGALPLYRAIILKIIGFPDDSIIYATLKSPAAFGDKYYLKHLNLIKNDTQTGI